MQNEWHVWYTGKASAKTASRERDEVVKKRTLREHLLQVSEFVNTLALTMWRMHGTLQSRRDPAPMREMFVPACVKIIWPVVLKDLESIIFEWLANTQLRTIFAFKSHMYREVYKTASADLLEYWTNLRKESDGRCTEGGQFLNNGGLKGKIDCLLALIHDVPNVFPRGSFSVHFFFNAHCRKPRVPDGCVVPGHCANADSLLSVIAFSLIAADIPEICAHVHFLADMVMLVYSEDALGTHIHILRTSGRRERGGVDRRETHYDYYPIAIEREHHIQLKKVWRTFSGLLSLLGELGCSVTSLVCAAQPSSIALKARMHHRVSFCVNGIPNFERYMRIPKVRSIYTEVSGEGHTEDARSTVPPDVKGDRQRADVVASMLVKCDAGRRTSWDTSDLIAVCQHAAKHVGKRSEKANQRRLFLVAKELTRHLYVTKISTSPRDAIFLGQTLEAYGIIRPYDPNRKECSSSSMGSGSVLEAEVDIKAMCEKKLHFAANATNWEVVGKFGEAGQRAVSIYIQDDLCVVLEVMMIETYVSWCTRAVRTAFQYSVQNLAAMWRRRKSLGFAAPFVDFEKEDSKKGMKKEKQKKKKSGW
eukprot:jgi/Bigna1/76472/fgenesh1_pg.41_\